MGFTAIPEVPVDQMNPECEISIVDIEAVGAFVHCPVTPLGSLLCPDLAALVHDVAVPVLHVVQLHVGLVVGGDGHVVLGLDVGQQVVADEQQGLVAYRALVIAFLGDVRLPVLLDIVLHPCGVGLVEVGAKITVVEAPVADLADGLTLVLVVVAEHAVGVNLPDRQVAREVPVYLDLGEVLLAVVPHTNLVSGKMSSQSASGEREYGLTNVTSWKQRKM